LKAIFAKKCPNVSGVARRLAEREIFKDASIKMKKRLSNSSVCLRNFVKFHESEGFHAQNQFVYYTSKTLVFENTQCSSSTAAEKGNTNEPAVKSDPSPCSSQEADFPEPILANRAYRRADRDDMCGKIFAILKKSAHDKSNSALLGPKVFFRFEWVLSQLILSTDLAMDPYWMDKSPQLVDYLVSRSNQTLSIVKKNDEYLINTKAYFSSTPAENTAVDEVKSILRSGLRVPPEFIYENGSTKLRHRLKTTEGVLRFAEFHPDIFEVSERGRISLVASGPQGIPTTSSQPRGQIVTSMPSVMFPQAPQGDSQVDPRNECSIM